MYVHVPFQFRRCPKRSALYISTVSTDTDIPNWSAGDNTQPFNLAGQHAAITSYISLKNEKSE